MTLSEKQRRGIESSHIFVCLIPEGGLIGIGAAQLDYAASLGKTIFYWLPNGRKAPVPIHPGRLFTGDGRQLISAVEEYLEMTPGDGVTLIEGGY